MKSKFYIYSGAILTAIVLSVIFIWISTFVGNTNLFIENKNLFLSNFPKQIRNVNLLTCIQMALCVLSIYLFRKGMSMPISKLKKTVINIATAANFLIIIWLLFTLL